MNSSPITDPSPAVRPWMRLAALFGFAGVALGAFGAHGLKGHLEAVGAVDWWHKATLYQLVHVVAALVAALAGRPRASQCFLLGILLFSGSLYAMSLFSWRFLGPVTPVGGVLFLAGWLLLAFPAARPPVPPPSDQKMPSS